MPLALGFPLAAALLASVPCWAPVLALPLCSPCLCVRPAPVLALPLAVGGEEEPGLGRGDTLKPGRSKARAMSKTMASRTATATPSGAHTRSTASPFTATPSQPSPAMLTSELLCSHVSPATLTVRGAQLSGPTPHPASPSTGGCTHITNQHASSPVPMCRSEFHSRYQHFPRDSSTKTVRRGSALSATRGSWHSEMSLADPRRRASSQKSSRHPMQQHPASRASSKKGHSEWAAQTCSVEPRWRSRMASAFSVFPRWHVK